MTASPLPGSTRSARLNRLLAVAAATLGAVAHAQAMGQGIISYATPIILFLGAGAILVALVSAIFMPHLVKSAIWAAVILVVVFFVLHNLPSLQSAVQQ